MDRLRKRTRAYEYLCHLEEAKQWLEIMLDESLPDVDELSDCLANGVVLAKVSFGLFFFCFLSYLTNHHQLASILSTARRKVFDPEQTAYLV